MQYEINQGQHPTAQESKYHGGKRVCRMVQAAVRIPHEQRNVFSSLRILHEERESVRPILLYIPSFQWFVSSHRQIFILCRKQSHGVRESRQAERLQSKQMVCQETSYSKVQVLNHAYCSRPFVHNKLIAPPQTQKHALPIDTQRRTLISHPGRFPKVS